MEDKCRHVAGVSAADTAPAVHFDETCLGPTPPFDDRARPSLRCETRARRVFFEMAVRAQNIALGQLPLDRAKRPRIRRRESEVLLARVAVMQIERCGDFMTAPNASEPRRRDKGSDRVASSLLVGAPRCLTSLRVHRPRCRPRLASLLPGEDSNLQPSDYPCPEVSLGRGLSHCLGASLRCRHWALSL